MNFTADRKELAKAVKTALKAASRMKDVPAMNGVLMKADAAKGVLTVTGTDGTMQIQCRLKCEHISESGAAVVPSVCADMLRLLPGDTVEVGPDPTAQNTLTLGAGQCVYALPYLEAEEFPKIFTIYPKEYISVRGINALIRHAAFAAAENNAETAKRGLQCVKLSFQGGKSTAEATNGMVAAIVKTPHGSDGSLDLILPERVLNTLSETVASSEELYVGVREKSVVFMTESMTFSTLLHTGETVDIGKIFERFTPVYRATADAKELYDLTANIVAILGEKDDRCVTISIESGKITAKTKTATGCASASIQATDTVPTEGDGFHYNPKWLIDCWRLAAGPTVISMDRRGFLMIEANHNRYCVVPRGPVTIRLPEPKKEKKTKAA